MTKLIYTDHAVERMYQRAVSKSLIQKTVNDPDKREREADGDIEFIKEVKRSGGRKNLHVVAMSKGKDTWLIKTVFVRGEDDPSFAMKMFRMLLMRLFHRK